MPRRKLIKGDRVKITGPWSNQTPTNPGGERYIGLSASVVKVRLDPCSMPIHILIDNIDTINDPSWRWCRENLRALPRKKS